MKKYIDRLLEERKALKANGVVKMPTDKERRAHQHRTYVQSGRMGSKHTPIYH